MTRSPKTPQNQHLVCLPGGNQKARERSPFPIPKPPRNAIVRPNRLDSETFTPNLQQLEEQALRINQLSAELTAAIAELKEIGDRVDRSSIAFRKNLGHHWFPERICNYGEIQVPRIRQKENGILVLSSHRVDLFAAQLEARLDANFVAHLLRQRSLDKQFGQPSISTMNPTMNHE